ncbi:MAG: glutarate dioxygenase GlaH [Vulcanimicrobiaceae bacterium]
MLDIRSAYRVGRHPVHPRIRHIEIEPHAMHDFLRDVASIDVQELQYVPFMRFVIGRQLDAALGGTFGSTIRDIIADRATGGFTIGVAGATHDDADYVRFGTAVAHLVGPANHDAMSGTFYARFTVEHTDESDSYLRQAYRDMTLHTDGTFVDDATDWLLMMKFAERNARGGESRLLHLDDWNDLATFATAPLARVPLTYKSPPSKNVAQVVKRPTFFTRDGHTCLSFIDQFVYPSSGAQATYLHDLSQSLERAAVAMPLPVGDLVMLNNAFWAHGRAAFESDAGLYRELMRQRGVFAT